MTLAVSREELLWQLDVLRSGIGYKGSKGVAPTSLVHTEPGADLAFAAAVAVAGCGGLLRALRGGEKSIEACRSRRIYRSTHSMQEEIYTSGRRERSG
jgi:hypothetical protein